MKFLTDIRAFFKIKDEVLTRLEEVERANKSTSLEVTDLYDKLLRHARGGQHQPGRPIGSKSSEAITTTEQHDSQGDLPFVSERRDRVSGSLGAGKHYLLERARAMKAKKDGI